MNDSSPAGDSLSLGTVDRVPSTPVEVRPQPAVPENTPLLRAESATMRVVEVPNVEGEPSRDGTRPKLKLSYIFTGKLTLFPLVIFWMIVGVAFVFVDTGHSAVKGYSKFDLILGLLGVLLFVLGLVALVLLVGVVVIRISFSMTPSVLEIRKQGVLRRSVLQFDAPSSKFHVFRTHFVEDKAWLCLVVEEHGVFWRIMSWKGSADQRIRFLRLFARLEDSLAQVQGRDRPAHRGHFIVGEHVSADIVTREEVAVMAPFRERLASLEATGRRSVRFGPKEPSERLNRAEDVLCIEDIPVRRVDRFFQSFNGSKRVKKWYVEVSRRGHYVKRADVSYVCSLPSSQNDAKSKRRFVRS